MFKKQITLLTPVGGAFIPVILLPCEPDVILTILYPSTSKLSTSEDKFIVVDDPLI